MKLVTDIYFPPWLPLKLRKKGGKAVAARSYLKGVVLLAVWPLLSGCFFGTFQTAETLGPGEVNAGWYANYPL